MNAILLLKLHQSEYIPELNILCKSDIFKMQFSSRPSKLRGMSSLFNYGCKAAAVLAAGISATPSVKATELPMRKIVMSDRWLRGQREKREIEKYQRPKGKYRSRIMYSSSI